MNEPETGALDSNSAALIEGQNFALRGLGWTHSWVSAKDNNSSSNAWVVYSGGRKYETPLAITSGVLFPYIGDIKVYISPDEPSNPGAGAVSGEKTRIRSYSLNACLGTTRADELTGSFGFDAAFQAAIGASNLIDLGRLSTTTVGTIKKPQQMLCTIVEDDEVDYNNQGWLVLPNTPNWTDWPAPWRPDAITFSYADGSTDTYELANKTLPVSWVENGHRWPQPIDPLAGFAVDWKFFRDRLNPGVIPNSNYLFGGQ